MVEKKKDRSKEECLIKGRVDFIDKFGAVYVNGRSLEYIVRKGDYIVVCKLQGENSHDGGKI